MRGLRLLTCLTVLFVLFGAAPVIESAWAQQVSQSLQGDGESGGPVAGNVPGGSLGNSSDSEMWRAIRQGDRFGVSIPDQQAAVMVQSEGDLWRLVRNGPIMIYGGLAILGMFVLLGIFYLFRGRIRIEHGMAGRTIERFNGFERAIHWMVAVSFILLAITGANHLWGKYTLLPIFGPEIFATFSLWAKYAHNFLAFPFMIGVVVMFVMWVVYNIPNKYDLVWLSKAGGLFTKGSHPPSKRFNAGQKLIFWSVVLGGLSLSLSGIAMLFPFQTDMWAKTFGVMQSIGFNVPDPATVTPMMEMQLSTLWHVVVSVVMIAIILAHIYIGSVGMEGAFDAMGSGQVDVNWAREHHDLWVKEVEEETETGRGPPQAQPAE